MRRQYKNTVASQYSIYSSEHLRPVFNIDIVYARAQKIYCAKLAIVELREVSGIANEQIDIRKFLPRRTNHPFGEINACI